MYIFKTVNCGAGIQSGNRYNANRPLRRMPQHDARQGSASPEQREIADSLELLKKDWSVDPVLEEFVLGRIGDVSDHVITHGGVTFHIPYLNEHSRYVLWKCLWPDCHNCCERQGRLPLTADDLIVIGAGLKYSRTSEFLKKETITATYSSGGGAGGGQETIMTTINLKRKEGETASEDGTRIPCRFLDGEGGCSMHPSRPGVCYLYPFTTWTQNDGGAARIHATYQFTGDCPGFYLADSTAGMMPEIEDYSVIIRDYNLASARTERESLGCSSIM